MAGQTEVKPVHGGCRHLRARYKVLQRGRGAFPTKELLRYECEQGIALETDDDTQKCLESPTKCWHTGG